MRALPTGGIISAFRFDSYKVDFLNYRMKPNVAMLSAQGIPDNTSWKMEFAFRQPMYLKIPKKYVAGVNLKLSLLPNPPEEADVAKDFLIQAELGIVGMFSVEEDRLSQEVEEELVKVQAPAILFPYLRATLTSLLSNAGFGSFILPLLNVQEMAKHTAAPLEILVAEK